MRKIERAATSREVEEKLTQNQMHELLESEHARTFVEGAEERGFVEPAEIEAFALEHDLGEDDAEQFQRELMKTGLDTFFTVVILYVGAAATLAGDADLMSGDTKTLIGDALKGTVAVLLVQGFYGRELALVAALGAYLCARRIGSSGIYNE